VDPDDGVEDEGPYFAWLPPDDRLWRHPSEVPPGDPALAGQPQGAAEGADGAEEPDTGSGGGVALAAPPLEDHPRVSRTWLIALVAGLSRHPGSGW
jgi:hypothetical protein